jgi:Uma2 family endonuclease
MTQEEFHFAYEQMPERYRAELLGGIVFEPSPLGLPHGKTHTRLNTLFDTYSALTPGTEVADNATVMLGKEDEVQPDIILRVLPRHGGRSKTTKDSYVKGAPELVAEVAHSSRAIDLHFKKERYALAGVLEYIVVCLDPEQIYWFDLPGKRTLTADRDGVFRSEVFPGLWVHGQSVLQLHYQGAMDTLNQGLRTPEHEEFVARLAGKKSCGRTKLQS